VAFEDFQEETGALRIIPGNNRLPLNHVLNEQHSVPVVMEPGSAFIYTGNIIHGGGANQTTHRWLKGLEFNYLLGWLTPEEATAFALSSETVKKLPQKALELLGWPQVRKPIPEEESAEAFAVWQLDEEDMPVKL
jgi:ectoine hydroxylase-related dioxygenase (phytanoyl-CoA dioxygenase family)